MAEQTQPLPATEANVIAALERFALAPDAATQTWLQTFHESADMWLVSLRIISGNAAASIRITETRALRANIRAKLPDSGAVSMLVGGLIQQLIRACHLGEHALLEELAPTLATLVILMHNWNKIMGHDPAVEWLLEMLTGGEERLHALAFLRALPITAEALVNTLSPERREWLATLLNVQPILTALSQLWGETNGDRNRQARVFAAFTAWLHCGALSEDNRTLLHTSAWPVEALSNFSLEALSEISAIMTTCAPRMVDMETQLLDNQRLLLEDPNTQGMHETYCLALAAVCNATPEPGRTHFFNQIVLPYLNNALLDGLHPVKSDPSTLGVHEADIVKNLSVAAAVIARVCPLPASREPVGIERVQQDPVLAPWQEFFDSTWPLLTQAFPLSEGIARVACRILGDLIPDNGYATYFTVVCEELLTAFRIKPFACHLDAINRCFESLLSQPASPQRVQLVQTLVPPVLSQVLGAVLGSNGVLETTTGVKEHPEVASEFFALLRTCVRRQPTMFLQPTETLDRCAQHALMCMFVAPENARGNISNFLEELITCANDESREGLTPAERAVFQEVVRKRELA